MTVSFVGNDAHGMISYHADAITKVSDLLKSSPSDMAARAALHAWANDLLAMKAGTLGPEEKKVLIAVAQAAINGEFSRAQKILDGNPALTRYLSENVAAFASWTTFENNQLKEHQGCGWIVLPEGCAAPAPDAPAVLLPPGSDVIRAGGLQDSEPAPAPPAPLTKGEADALAQRAHLPRHRGTMTDGLQPMSNEQLLRFVEALPPPGRVYRNATPPAGVEGEAADPRAHVSPPLLKFPAGKPGAAHCRTNCHEENHPAGSEMISFNPFAAPVTHKAVPKRTDFEKTDPTAHGYKAIRNENDDVIGYTRSSNGYTEIRDVEGKIVQSSEIPITSDLLSPVDLLTLPIGGLAKIGLEAAGEELVAVAARWGVRETAEATGEAAVKVLSQATAKLATTRGALAAAGAAYTLYDYLSSDGGNPAEIQGVLGQALADVIPQDLVTGANVAGIPGGVGNPRTGAMNPSHASRASPEVTLHNFWELAKNFPPDAVFIGTALTLPGGQKISVYLSQPMNPNINKGSYWAKEFKEHPLDVIDWSKPPLLFFSGIPKSWLPNNNSTGKWAPQGVATYNLATNMLEGGYGKSISLPFNSTFFWNIRGGVSTTSPGAWNAAANVGLLNASVLPGMVKVGAAIASYIASVARTAEATAVADAPETGGTTAIAGATIPVAKNVLLQMLKTAKWSVGFGWRSAEFISYSNGERDLNFSGGKVRLTEGNGPGGSGLPPSAFAIDLAQPSVDQDAGPSLSGSGGAASPAKDR